MNLTIRMTGTDEDEILRGLDQLRADIILKKTHVGQSQMAVGDRGWFGHWKFEGVETPAPVARPSFAEAADQQQALLKELGTAPLSRQHVA